MIVLGLTGSIAMGKSTLAGIFRALGVPVFDADATVHSIYNGENASLIDAVFPGIIVDGKIDRKRLSAVVINNSDALNRLEAVVHPIVAEARNRFLQNARTSGARLAVVDVPLLFESGGEIYVDAVAVVSARMDLQRSRAMSRPGADPARFDLLLARQTPDVEKRHRAHFVINTSNSLEDSRRQAEDVLRALVSLEG